MDPYYVTLIYICLALLLVVLSMLLAIIYMRLATNRKESEYLAKAALWEEYYLPYVQNEATLKETAALFRGEENYDWLWRFFAPYLNFIKGEDFEETRELCREIGLTAYYQADLQLGSAGTRAKAASVLGTLHCRRSVEPMLTMLKSDDRLLVQAAAQGLAKSDQPETFTAVAKTLLNNTYFTYEGITEILVSYGPEICDFIVEQLSEEVSRLCEDRGKAEAALSVKNKGPADIHPSAYPAIMVSLLGHFRHREALPVLGELLPLADEETRVQILKTFLRIGEVPEEFNLTQCLNHPHWVMRNFGAKLFNLTKKEQSIEPLLGLLKDKHWWVRFSAAEALLRAGDDGRAALKKAAAGPDDDPAAGISRYILKKGDVAS